MIEKYMQELAKELELAEIESLGKNEYSIPFEDNLDVVITGLPQGFFFKSTICECPKENREGFLAHLMLGNLFGQGTHKAVLGLTEDGNMLTLFKVVEYNIDYKQFRDALEDFINSVDFWREEALNHK